LSVNGVAWSGLYFDVNLRGFAGVHGTEALPAAFQYRRLAGDILRLDPKGTSHRQLY
jgi:hypothetical protein